MYTTCISINTQFLLFIGKLQGGPNSYPLLVHLVYMYKSSFGSKGMMLHCNLQRQLHCDITFSGFLISIYTFNHKIGFY